MEKTTRNVAGHLVRKSAKGVAKNVIKNIVRETAISSIITGGSILMSKTIKRNISMVAKR